MIRVNYEEEEDNNDKTPIFLLETTGKPFDLIEQMIGCPFSFRF